MTPRRLGEPDLDAIDSLRPTEWPSYRATFERYFSLPCVETYGLGRDPLEAMGSLITFGTSAWLAQIITRPESRGRGLGRAMVDFLGQRAEALGVKTLSLVATDLGFPVYAKAGFRVEGEYTIWTRPTPAPAVPEASDDLRPLEPDDRSDVALLDRLVSGEDRTPFFADRWAGWKVGKASEGFWLPGMGEGLVTAIGPSGVPLLHRRLDGALRVIFPQENEAAAQVALDRGFTAEKTIRRMVRGPALVRKPQNLWSRIGGNLG